MSDPGPWVALLLAALLAPLVGGRWNVPFAAWIAPAFLLVFVRTQPSWRGYLVAAIVVAIGSFIALKGQVPLPPGRYAAMILVGATIAAVPYLFDSLAADRWDGSVATIAFPVAMVAVELLSASGSPFGNWGSLAHTQYGDLVLMQAAAVGGTYVIAFLMSWFASTLAWAWARDFSPGRVGFGVMAYGLVLCGVLLFGAARLALRDRTGPTVRVASLTEPELTGVMSTSAAFGLLMADGDLDDAEWASLVETSGAVTGALLEATAREARAGARLVLWAEGAGLVTADYEPALTERAGALARQEGIYLAMALAVAHRPGPKHLENKVLMLTPGGEVAFQYRKARPVPGLEAAHTFLGDTELGWLDTPFGRIGVLICFDADVPRLARQVGRYGVDILLLPASDWRELDPLHTHMAVFRGIESGASIVRQARWGLSLASDPYGRVLASQDHSAASRPVMVAQVPTRGVATAWSRLTGPRHHAALNRPHAGPSPTVPASSSPAAAKTSRRRPSGSRK